MEKSCRGAAGYTDVRASETSAAHDRLAPSHFAQQTSVAHIHASVGGCGQDRRDFRGWIHDRTSLVKVGDVLQRAERNKLNKNLCPSDSSILIKTKSKYFIDTCVSLRWLFATNLRCHQSYLCFTEWKMILLIFSQTTINMYNTLFFQQESFFDGNSYEDGALSLLRTTSLYSRTSVITYTFNLNYSAIS